MKDNYLCGTFLWMSHSRVQILMVVSSVQFIFVYWRICWTHFKLNPNKLRAIFEQDVHYAALKESIYSLYFW